MNNENNQTQVNKVDAQSRVSERINEVLDQKITKAISRRVKDSTVTMVVEEDRKCHFWTVKYEDNYGQRYRMTVRWWHKDDSKDGDLMMTITIENKVGARYQQVGDPVHVKSVFKDNVDTVLDAMYMATGQVVNVTRIESDWGQMMDITLITKKEGNHTMAMVRANCGGEITESGWCYVHDTMSREEMALEVMLTCWVNSEVMGRTGSK